MSDDMNPKLTETEHLQNLPHRIRYELLNVVDI